jgi:hypothetical protein
MARRISRFDGAVHEPAIGPKRHLARRSDLVAFGGEADIARTLPMYRW